MGTKGDGQFQRYKIIGVILLIVTLFMVFTEAFKSGSSMEGSREGIDNYNSVRELMENSSINLDFPSFVLNQQNVEVRSFMGSLVEMGNEQFVLKAANFIDVKADPLGLYEQAATDKSFTSKGSINYVRYRLGYPNYENCTLINWCTDTTSYGMMLPDVYDEEYIFNLLEINKDIYTEQANIDEALMDNKDNTQNTQDDNIKYIAIAGKYGIGLPILKSNINLYDYDGYTIAYIDKTSCFILVYNDFDINNKTFDQHESIILDSGIVMYYKEDNPFEDNSIAYSDYSNILSAIDNNLITFKYLD